MTRKQNILGLILAMAIILYGLISLLVSDRVYPQTKEYHINPEHNTVVISWNNVYQDEKGKVKFNLYYSSAYGTAKYSTDYNIFEVRLSRSFFKPDTADLSISALDSIDIESVPCDPVKIIFDKAPSPPVPIILDCLADGKELTKWKFNYAGPMRYLEKENALVLYGYNEGSLSKIILSKEFYLEGRYQFAVNANGWSKATSYGFYIGIDSDLEKIPLTAETILYRFSKYLTKKIYTLFIISDGMDAVVYNFSFKKIESEDITPPPVPKIISIKGE